MQKYISILSECAMFRDINKENIISMLSCLDVKVIGCKQAEVIFAEGEEADNIGILLSGSVQIVRIDYFGNRSIVAMIEPGQIFGESFACAGITRLPVDVIATKDSEIMIINAKRIISTCNNTCEFHRKVIFNLLRVVATKNLLFHQKIEITSKRSTREKLMTYLLIQATKNKSNSFEIPFNRQELADYLEVERSGLSAEISKLRKEGMLENKKNYFVLKG